MSMIRYEPWTFVNRLHQDLDQLFPARLRTDSEQPTSIADWVPAVDFKEDERQFVLWVDLPGVNPDDVEITMENSLLSIQGQRRTESTEERDGWRRVERSSGRFLRRLSLPDGADENAITARSQNGVLEIVIPKQAKELARKIKVNAA